MPLVSCLIPGKGCLCGHAYKNDPSPSESYRSPSRLRMFLTLWVLSGFGSCYVGQGVGRRKDGACRWPGDDQGNTTAVLKAGIVVRHKNCAVGFWRVQGSGLTPKRNKLTDISMQKLTRKQRFLLCLQTRLYGTSKQPLLILYPK